MTSSSTSFARVRARVADPEAGERAAAEAFAAGAQGLEEREVDGAIELLVYALRDRVAAVRAALETAGAGTSAAEGVPDRDWAEAWKQHLEAIEISDRLVVRPSFVVFELRPDQSEIVIDPGQAFGTGSHESTRLALEWVTELAPALAAGSRVLDVGVGTGVLALAALRLADVTCLGIDLDPLAPEAARRNARVNGLDGRLQSFTGGIEALAAGARFELVLANLLRGELAPILPALASHVAADGTAVLSGLLESEREGVVAEARVAGLREAGFRRRVDASGVAWVSLRMERLA